jgi:serine/threonine protein kinase
MRAPPNSGSVPADESGLAGALPLTLATDIAVRSVQQRQLEPSGHESADDDLQLSEVTVDRKDPAMRGAAFVDDNPTAQQLADPQQRAITAEVRVDLEPGAVLSSRYVLEDMIGRGGTSIIFRAKDLQRALAQDTAAELVAIKVLRAEQRSDPMALGRLKREFQQMRCLSHPGIVRVFDLDCDGDVWFISMELVAGVTVKTWLETPGNHANALRIIGACCEALEHAHSLGILHGDVKDTNVMVTDDGTAKLIDFGSVPGLDSRVAARSELIPAVTPLYASPQILAGKSAERRDDVYSLASLSYKILSGGRHPFGGHPSLEDGRAKSAPTYVRAIPAELFKVIERGLSVERERRPASVKEFLRDLTDADRRRCADATSTATPARDNVREVRHPGSVMHTADNAALATSLESVGGGRGAYRHARPFVGLSALVIAIAGMAALCRLGTHRDVIHTADLLPEASATSPEPVATARAQSNAFLETKPLLHDSGVISFEASTVHASAMQSLVAISVQRLHASKSRGAFVWRVQRGTASPGVDYERIEPQVVRLIEGQVARTLFIPLISTPATSVPRGPRTLTVVLEQVAGGPALGRFARVTVVIDPAPTSSPSTHYQARAEESKIRVASTTNPAMSGPW